MTAIERETIQAVELKRERDASEDKFRVTMHDGRSKVEYGRYANRRHAEMMRDTAESANPNLVVRVEPITFTATRYACDICGVELLFAIDSTCRECAEQIQDEIKAECAVEDAYARSLEMGDPMDEPRGA